MRTPPRDRIPARGFHRGFFNRPIWITALLAVILRLAAAGALAPRTSSQLHPDEREYLALAGVGPWPGAERPGSSDPAALQAIRPPVYPAFLRVTGGGPGSLMAQACIGGLTAALAAWLAGRFGGRRGALGAGLLVALDPVSILYASFFLSETLFAFLVLAAVALWIQREVRAGGMPFLSGLAFSLLALCRPIGLPAGPIFAPAGPRRARAAVFLIAWFLPVALWGCLVQAGTGHTPLLHLAARTLVVYRAAPVLAEADGIDRAEAAARLGSPEAPSLNAGIQVLVEHPWITARNAMAGAGRILFGSGAGAWISRLGEPGNTRASAIPLGYHVAAVLWCLTAYWMAGRTLLRRGTGIPRVRLLLLLGLLLLVPAGGEGYSRFRVPAWPILAFLAGASLGDEPQPDRASSSTRRRPVASTMVSAEKRSAAMACPRIPMARRRGPSLRS